MRLREIQVGGESRIFFEGDTMSNEINLSLTISPTDELEDIVRVYLEVSCCSIVAVYSLSLSLSLSQSIKTHYCPYMVQ